MFQYAVGRVLALKNNTELVFNIEGYLDTHPRPFKKFTLRTYDLDVFTISGRIAKKNEIPFLFRMYWKGKSMLVLDALRRRMIPHRGKELSPLKYQPSLLTLPACAYLDGLFQFPQYFKGYEDILRKDFTLRHAPSEEIQDMIQEVSTTNSVCIFVRRTDFVGNAYHEVVGREYYYRALQKLEESVSIDKLYVFSDDIKWCKANLTFSYPVFFTSKEYKGEKYSGELILMSSCKHFIIPNSSFSWWAAWLSKHPDKVVVCPTEWYPGVSSLQFVPREWVRI